MNVSDVKMSDPSMQENILNISRTVYAVTYPSSHNLEDIYKNTLQRSEHYNTNVSHNIKSVPVPVPVSNLEHNFLSSNLKENTRQYFPRNHMVKQEPSFTEYDGEFFFQL